MVEGRKEGEKGKGKQRKEWVGKGCGNKNRASGEKRESLVGYK